MNIGQILQQADYTAKGPIPGGQSAAGEAFMPNASSMGGGRSSRNPVQAGAGTTGKPAGKRGYGIAVGRGPARVRNALTGPRVGPKKAAPAPAAPPPPVPGPIIEEPGPALPPPGPTEVPETSLPSVGPLQMAASERGGPGMAELSAVGSLAGLLGQRNPPRFTPALSVMGRKAY